MAKSNHVFVVAHTVLKLGSFYEDFGDPAVFGQRQHYTNGVYISSEIEVDMMN